MLLTMLCPYSNFVEAVPISTFDTDSVIKALEDRWLTYGWPAEIISDRGPQFMSKKFKAWCAARGIKCSPTTAYHPKANPVERTHRWLNATFHSSVAKYGGDWHTHLRQALSAHNKAPASGEKHSPFFLFFGRHPRLPIDNLIHRGNAPEVVAHDLTPRTAEEAKDVHDNHRQVKERRAAANARRYINSHKLVEYDVGDWVLVAVKPIKSKQNDSWLGPYPIVKKISPLVYVVRRKKWGRFVDDSLNIERLKKWRFADPIHTLDGFRFETPVGLELRISTIPRAGWGVVATRAWEKHRQLGTYTGETLSAAEFKARYPNDDSRYALEMTDEQGQPVFIDASNPTMSNWTRFINAPGDGEQPNVRVVSNGVRAVVQTLRFIVPGEEILWDYGPSYPWPEGPRPCSTNDLVRFRQRDRLEKIRAEEEKLERILARIPPPMQAPPSPPPAAAPPARKVAEQHPPPRRMMPLTLHPRRSSPPLSLILRMTTLPWETVRTSQRNQMRTAPTTRMTKASRLVRASLSKTLASKTDSLLARSSTATPMTTRMKFGFLASIKQLVQRCVDPTPYTLGPTVLVL